MIYACGAWMGYFTLNLADRVATCLALCSITFIVVINHINIIIIKTIYISFTTGQSSGGVCDYK
ncbi:hypothetical protein XCR1_960004 [Xenorhabdus cabanillasii JM26]|uniref:Uncharacterized protein n=1 Tax=Xenorhabdus cabanillasii JM26 TaxID=1427517 RepID=W1JA91_9GAMM|nr:hypothetical protein XCR1_960004 [Xenorhabdus cabanillasii JM26]